MHIGDFSSAASKSSPNLVLSKRMVYLPSNFGTEAGARTFMNVVVHDVLVDNVMAAWAHDRDAEKLWLHAEPFVMAALAQHKRPGEQLFARLERAEDKEMAAIVIYREFTGLQPAIVESQAT